MVRTEESKVSKKTCPRKKAEELRPPHKVKSVPKIFHGTTNVLFE